VRSGANTVPPYGTLFAGAHTGMNGDIDVYALLYLDLDWLDVTDHVVSMMLVVLQSLRVPTGISRPR
jgi:endonuclease V-like protein UPF0215 family